jgi:general secretion pathway protein G
MTSKHKGFTLVELIVTIAVLTLLAGVLVPSVGSYLEKGKKGRVAAELREIASVYNQYKADTGLWPDPEDATTTSTGKYGLVGMPCFFRNTVNKNGWDGPYFNEGVMGEDGMVLATYSKDEGAAGLVDPWENPYTVYTFADGYESTAGAIVIVSAGPNGRIDSEAKGILAGKASEDDLIKVITYKLD